MKFFAIFYISCFYYLTSSQILANNFCKDLIETKFENLDSQYQPHTPCKVSPYVQKCGRGRCATSETMCKEFKLKERFYSSRLYKDIVKKVNKSKAKAMRHHEKRFKMLKGEIKNCTLYQTESFNETTWQPSDVCMRRRKCYKQVTRINLTQNQIGHIKVDLLVLKSN